MRFRPAPVPTIFVAIGLLILINLGLWQLRRNEETNARVARVESRTEGPPLTDLAGKTPEELSWHRVDLSGRFLPEDPLLVTGRFEFGEVGFDVVQPFQVEGGPALLVNRGWIPREDWEATLIRISTGDAPVQVEGLVLDIAEFEGDTDVQPIPAGDGLPERWPTDAYATLVRRYDSLAPIVIVAGQDLDADQKKNAQLLPVSGYRAKPKISPHLEYAATWFLIAGTLPTIWVAAGVRRGSKASAG